MKIKFKSDPFQKKKVMLALIILIIIKSDKKMTTIFGCMSKLG